jgi:hypothetical protein
MKIFSLSTSALKYLKRISICYLGKLYKSLLKFLKKKKSFKSLLLSSLGACTFTKIILHQRRIRTTHDTLSLTNPNTLTADMIFFCGLHKTPFQIDKFLIFFQWKKNCSLVFLFFTLCPTSTPAHPVNPIYI